MPFPQRNERRNKSYKKSKVSILSNTSKEEPTSSAEVRTVQVASGEIDSQELFQSERELKIRHGGEVYRLRRTGLNKLILTK